KGVNYPKGLITWLREIGPENVYARLVKLYEYYHEPRYRPSAGLKAMIGTEHWY
ncbi:MAG: 3-hydroxyacyl-CoA dehydrogenase, C-terminal domain, partial [Bacteroidota bacterium]